MMKLNKNTIVSDIWTGHPELFPAFWAHGIFNAGAPYLKDMTISEVCDCFAVEPQVLILSLVKEMKG